MNSLFLGRENRSPMYQKRCRKIGNGCFGFSLVPFETLAQPLKVKLAVTHQWDLHGPDFINNQNHIYLNEEYANYFYLPKCIT